MLQKISLARIYADNVHESIEFYSKILKGPYYNYDQSDALFYCGSGEGKFYLEIHKKTKQPNPIVIFFSVENLDKTFQNLLEKNTKLTNKGQTSHYDFFTFMDSEGNEFGICQYYKAYDLHSSESCITSKLYNIEVAVKNSSLTHNWYENTFDLIPCFYNKNNTYFEYNVGSVLFSLDFQKKSKYKKNNGIFILFNTSSNIQIAEQLLINKGMASFDGIETIAGCLYEINIKDPNGLNVALIERTPYFNRLRKYINNFEVRNEQY